MHIDLEFHFQNYKHFLEYFEFYLLTTVYTKKTIPNFCLFVCLRSCNDKNKFSFLKKSTVKPQHVLFANEPFLRKMLVSFFSSNILLYIEKNSVEKSCRVLEMELKSTPQSTQNSFSRKSDITFCIIFNMISFANAQGSVKIRLACSKVFLLINYLMLT